MSFWWFWSAPPVIEPVEDEDLPRLADIHAKSFAHGWDEDELARLRSQDGVLMLLARRASPYGTRAPVGFVIMRQVADEAEVLTLAVDPRQRGRGVARRLMQEAMFRLYGERCASVFLEVDGANEAALHLYRSLRFQQVGERKGYYRQSEKDGTALVMRADLG